MRTLVSLLSEPELEKKKCWNPAGATSASSSPSSIAGGVAVLKNAL